MKPDDFIAAIAPAAVASMRDTSIPASFTIAEGALESGWGEHCPGFNLFGVKADPRWTGPVTLKPTREFFNGQWVRVDAKWRAYSDWSGSIGDHAAFLRSNPRYSVAFQHADDGEQFARQVAAAGYATDPGYPDLLISIMRSHQLKRFDVTTITA